MASTEEDLRAAAVRLARVCHGQRDGYRRIWEHLHGRRNEIYTPAKVTEEYRRLVEQSSFNILPFVVTNLVQALYFAGFRSSFDTDPEPEPVNAASPDAVLPEPPPRYTFEDAWQDNRMDGRQGPWFRSTVEYGISYVLALPGRVYGADDSQLRGELPVVFTPRSPRQMIALYEDPVNDEWPIWALDVHSETTEKITGELFDHETSYWVEVSGYAGEGAKPTIKLQAEAAPGAGRFDWHPKRHGAGVVPVVRSFDSVRDLDEVPRGKVEPLIPTQNQLNQTTFNLLMAQQYSAFRQRWVTGMEIQEDANGAAKVPFNVAVDKMLHAESPDARFGDFAQTDLGGYLQSRDKAQLFVSAVGQVPPHSMVVGAGISNISAEALAALGNSFQQDVADHKNAFGEAIEQLARLTGRLIGDDEMWRDRRAQVVWKDMTARSLAQIMDAWGKAVTMMGVPEEFAWEKLPDITELDLERIRAMREAGSSTEEILEALNAFEGETAAIAAAANGGEAGAVDTGAAADSAVPA